MIKLTTYSFILIKVKRKLMEGLECLNSEEFVPSSTRKIAR